MHTEELNGGVATSGAVVAVAPVKAAIEDVVADVASLGRTTAMEGDGFYNKYSDLQAALAATGEEIRVKALASISQDAIRGQHVKVADFASSQGHNSLVPIGAAVEDFLRKGAASVTAVHNDLPTNDWNTLIQLMASKESYIENKSDKVFSYSAGRDMRSRVFADGSLTFGWGSIAQHWLSEAPPIKGAIIHTLLPPSEELIRLARKDWRRYLECRSKELAVGGQLVHVEMACNDAGLMGNENVWRKTNEVMRRAFGTEAVEHVVAPMYVRTQAEWREPFCNPDLGLALADGELIRGVPDPKVSEYLKTKDADAFVDGFMGMYRAALAPSLALDKRFTTEQVDKFHKMLEQELRADPVAWAMEWNIMVMRITRIC